MAIPRRNKTKVVGKKHSKLHVKKNDTVYVRTGKDRGAQGKVLEVDPVKQRATVEGINIMKKHRKESQSGSGGGITDIPAPIHLSNLVVVCPHCKAHTSPTKKSVERTKEGKTKRYQVRQCKKCGEQLDQG
jgi:large subunit ribosomal protein L24